MKRAGADAVSSADSGIRNTQVKRVDAEQRDEKCDNKESGRRGHADQDAAVGGEMRQHRERAHRLY